MTVDTPGPVGRVSGAASILTLTCLLAACSPAADSPEDAAQAPPPRITAEHPVTSRPALEAGLVDGGAAGGGLVLAGEGSVDGLDGAAGSLAAILPADDLGESVDFYVGLLGFDVMASEPAEPPFRRVELARGGVRLVLVGPEAWQREMARFGEAPVAGGEPEGDEAEGDEARDAAEGVPGLDVGGGGAGPVLRLALADLAAVAEGLAEAGPVIEVRGAGEGGPGTASGRRLAVVDPAGNRLLLVPPGDP